MTYSAIHKALIVKPDKLQFLADSVLYSMRAYRKLTGTPLGKREGNGMLEDIDHAEKGLIDALKQAGIDLGVEWGHQIDLTEIE